VVSIYCIIVDNRGTLLHWPDVKQIAALGEPLLELQPAADDGIRVAFGGDVANSSVTLARILGASGIQVSVVTALGNSSYSAWLRGRLEREGIRVVEPRIDGHPGIYGLSLDPSSRPGFSYWRSTSAASSFFHGANIDEFRELLGAPQLLIVTGITLALCSASSFDALCRWIREHRDDCRVAFDCNFRRSLWASVTEARERIGTFEKLASVVATGTEDESLLWSAGSAAEIIRRVRQLRAEYVLRAGKDGCWVSARPHWEHIPTAPLTVVDSAGAGDAHFASYVAARISGCSKTVAASYANQVAAVVVCQRGSVLREGAGIPALPGLSSSDDPDDILLPLPSEWPAE
jgi:2-dehydro-3-deoxygluconokinase